VSEPHAKPYIGCKWNAADKYIKKEKLDNRKNKNIEKKTTNTPRKQRNQLVYSEGNILLGQLTDGRCPDTLLRGQSYRILLGWIDMCVYSPAYTTRGLLWDWTRNCSIKLAYMWLKRHNIWFHLIIHKNEKIRTIQPFVV
jgi:hypothetical protein